MAQRPEATCLASYRRWQGLGRQVRRGDRAVRLLVFVDSSHPIELDTLGNLAAGEAGRLKITSVFDIAQTDAIHVAEWPTAGAWLSGGTGRGDRSLQQGPPFGDRLGGSVPELLHHQLAALVRAEGYRFVLGPLPPLLAIRSRTGASWRRRVM